MAKEKKIGTRYYLNQRLKPKKILGLDRYPVYVQITYDRQTHQCLTPLGYLSKQEFKDFVEDGKQSKFKPALERFDDLIRTAIRAESKNKQDSFSLKGFSNRLEIYELPLMEVLEKKLRKSFLDFLKSHLDIQQIKQLDNYLFSFWNILDIVIENYESHLKQALLLKDLQYKLKGYLYLSGYLGLTKENPKEYEIPLVIDWFSSSLPTKFKDFLLHSSPIDTETKKESLGLFKNESKNSSILYLLKRLDVKKTDISLIINSIEKTLIPE